MNMISPLALAALQSLPEPKHINSVDRAISSRLITKLEEKAKTERNWFDPATMTPWMEDYYYGRKLR